MIHSPSEAIEKARSGDASDTSEACCFLVEAYASSRSQAMLKALTSLLWNEERCPLDMAALIVSVVPDDEVMRVAMGHPNSTLRANVIGAMESPRQVEHVLASKDKLDDPSLLAAAIERGLQLGLIDSPGRLGDAAPRLKAMIAGRDGEPSAAAERAFATMIQESPERDDVSHVRRYMGRTKWRSSLSAPIFRRWVASKDAARFKSDADKKAFEDDSAALLRDAGEMMSELGGDVIRGMVSEMEHRDAAVFAGGARRGLGKDDALDVDYIVATKSGDPAEVIRAIGADPVRRSREAIQLIMSKDASQASAIRELLPHVYYKVDQDELSRLWDEKPELRLPMLEAIGHRLPGRLLADIAIDGDGDLSLAAAAALAKKRQVTLLPLHLRDIEL